MYLPGAAVAYAIWSRAERELETELGRAPTENEVRAKLGYPIVLGKVDCHYMTIGLAGGSAQIPGTKFIIGWEPLKEGSGFKLTLMERPE